MRKEIIDFMVKACLMTLLFALFARCSSYDDLKVDSDSSKITLIRDKFNEAESKFINSGVKVNKTFRQSLERRIEWDKIFTNNDTSYVPITLLLPDSLSSNNGKMLLDGNVYLRISKLENNYQFDMLTLLPENGIPVGFTGNLLLEDYFIGNVSIAKYQNGIFIKSNKVNDQNASGKKALAMVYDCNDVLIGVVCVDPPIGPDGAQNIPPFCSNRYEKVCKWVVADPGYIPPPSIGGGGGGSSNSGYFSSIPNQLSTYLFNKPYGILKNVDCSTIQSWIDLGKVVVNQAQVDKLNSIVAVKSSSGGTGGPGITTVDVAKVQSLENAMSGVINLDYYSITVNNLPSGFSTPEALLSYFRLNINNMFSSSKTAEFLPYVWYGVNDTNLWNSSNPTNSVVAIDLGPEYGSVITTRATPQNWIFTTIYDPNFLSHPVTGNREFGFTTNSNGSYTFYTRGVDRLTGIGETFVQFMSDFTPDVISQYSPFDQGDQLWRSFQEGFTNFINNNNGSAFKITPTIKRANWLLIRQVLDGTKSITDLNSSC
ncbi:hypothetical protein I6I99_03965 [Sphingobacterium multivorum]|nr:hypothetical protein [Sphingobacterium multivorum]QQT31728.1 hypothetical protein I6I99_03965 [Sphingobacterium multivorum]